MQREAFASVRPPLNQVANREPGPAESRPFKALERRDCVAANPAQILAEIREMLHVVSDHILPDEPITMDSRLLADLALQSIELVSLAGRIRARYGAAANLAAFVTGLGPDLTDLRVGQVVEFLADALDTGEPDAVQPGNLRRHGSRLVGR